MPLWDLAIRGNWELTFTERRIATQKTTPTAGRYFHNPIPPIYTSPNSRVLLVGTSSQYAKPNWFLGARVSQFLYVSPSPTPDLISGVQTSRTERAGLNRLTLIKFEDYGVYPYVLELKIPFWLEDIYVEIWEYKGTIDDPTYQYDIEEILRKLESIEAQLGDTFTTSGNSSTQFDDPDNSASTGII